MKYIRSTLEFHISAPSAITLGKFDGLHQGHRHLLEQVKKAGADGLESVAFTFDISPRTVTEADVKVLLTNREREQVFEDFGLDWVVECPFTDELRRMEPYDFLKLLTMQINVKRIVAGKDFRFGKNRSGGYEDLQKHAAEFGYETVIVDKVQDGGADISSSRIRDLVVCGDMEEAARLLGYPYFITSVVEHGAHLGTTMGIPTVNQLPTPDKLLPPNGVYASRVTVGGKTYSAVTDIGVKPTTGVAHPVAVESHILDFDGELYGTEIRTSLIKYLRPERKFASLAELEAAINKDILSAKKL